ncbi:MAG TPA: hypothetical protein VF692_13930 [Pyrinomonadaceae bacterium]|jgi:hypothetical protein
MKEKHIQIFGIVLTIVYGLFVAWLYAAAPKTLEEVSIKAAATIESATTKGEVLIGAYEIDRAKFDEGLAAFRQDKFIAARDGFAKADPERRDARTQFYIAYSFYRQGFGRFSNDDALFRQGLEQINRVAALDKDFKSEDANLSLKTPAELKNEFEEGLKVTAGDFNPLKVLRERK